jgi:hypothetical protein
MFVYFLLLVLFVSCVLSEKPGHKKDLEYALSVKPLKDAPNVFFWRPQKVGSSTMLSVLMSYGFRYNFLPRRKGAMNSYCRRIAKIAFVNNYYENLVREADIKSYVIARTPGAKMSSMPVTKEKLQSEVLADSIPFKISLSHEICNLNAAVIHRALAPSFVMQPNLTFAPDQYLPEAKELFIVREPLSRAISVYYFWGELYKMKYAEKGLMKRGGKVSLALPSGPGNGGEFEGNHKRKDKKTNKSQEDKRRNLRLGSNNPIPEAINVGNVDSQYKYHGNESTPPPLDVAMIYANQEHFYNPGMPGPSYTWSAFADNPSDALAVIKSDRMCTLVLERLDELLVVAAHYLGWSLADVVVTKHRKAMSTHPKHTAWPQPAVRKIEEVLRAPQSAEFQVYEASNAKLDERIAALQKAGIDVPQEVEQLRALQKRVTKVYVIECLSSQFAGFHASIFFVFASFRSV